MPERSVYLDYSATSPPRPEVLETMRPYLEEAFGNPSSIHAYGRESRVAVEEARARLLAALGNPNGRWVFTGSGTEADNLAVLGFARRHQNGRVIRSSVEHKAVIQATDALRRAGYDVQVAPVNDQGVVDLDVLESLLPADERPTLVSIMWANNETGAVQPVASIAELCHRQGAWLHSDAVQAFGKVPTPLDEIPVDLLAISGHKLGGPKGIGALFVRAGVELEPLVYGGGQERGLRSGTENVAGIVGLVAAAETADGELVGEAERLRRLRDRLESGLQASLPGVRLNDAPNRLANVSNLSLAGVDVEGVLTALDLEGICVSSGSACTTGSVEPSHVMRAMGREGEEAANSIRFSLGWGTDPEDIEYVLSVFPRIIQRVRELEGVS